MTFDNLLVEREGGDAAAPVVTVTINRPAVLNALSLSTLDDLRRAFSEFRSDATVRVVILTGAGEKSFVAGADIKELAQQNPIGGREFARSGQALCDLIETLGKPVIAAINGFALGGGCELAMACTIRIASETARLGQPEVNLGIIPGYGGTQRLPRLVGKGRALELMLTGAPISATEAHRIGLLNRVVPPTELMPTARTVAAQLAAQPPVAVRYILEAVQRGLDGSMADALAHEATLFGLVVATKDMREGTGAFLDKRKPVFTGR
ncbi:MAG: enoyl-CoA hydratase [Acidimicrobiia bacterium]|nr:enoyl-CoA hydratase [Acidimicrobiia bacterium]